VKSLFCSLQLPRKSEGALRRVQAVKGRERSVETKPLILHACELQRLTTAHR
jgi:hypothetical protein